jgi:hypothetical protein
MSNIGTKGEYVRRESRARTTGGVVRILDLDHADSTITPEERGDDDRRWATACEHDLFVVWPTVREASAKAANPETWCPQCEQAAEARGYFTASIV